MGNRSSNSSTSSVSSNSRSTSHSTNSGNRRPQTAPLSECSICHLKIPSNELLDHKLAHELEREEGTGNTPSSTNAAHNQPPNYPPPPIQVFSFPVAGMFGSNVNNNNNNEQLAFQFFPFNSLPANNNNGNNADNLNLRMQNFNIFLQSVLQAHAVTHPPHVGNQGISRTDFERLSPFAYHTPAFLSSSSSSSSSSSTSVGSENKNNNNGSSDEEEKEKEQVRETDPCAVCLMQFIEGEDVVLTPCFHRYHTDCLWSWAREHGTCPMCKRELRTT